MSLLHRRHQLRRGDLDPDRQVDRDLRRHLRDRARCSRWSSASSSGASRPLRAEPGRAHGPAAAARRRREADHQGALPPASARSRSSTAIAPLARRLHRRRDARDHPVRQRQGRRRPLRDRRPHRHPLLLRLRLDLVLRPAARRLGVGLEVQLPRRDALGGAADLLRDLDGAGAARRDHDGRVALAGLDRRGPGPGLVRHPAVRRLPGLHGRPASRRPTGRRSTCRRRTPSWSPATRPSTGGCASAPTCWPSTSRCS